MPKYFSADSKFEVETTQGMNPDQRGVAAMRGVAKAHLTVYEDGEDCSNTLPTLADLLEQIDSATGLLSLERYVGLDLKMDPTPLRDLPQHWRVSPGYGFITNEARARARRSG